MVDLVRVCWKPAEVVRPRADRAHHGVMIPLVLSVRLHDHVPPVGADVLRIKDDDDWRPYREIDEPRL